MITINLIDLHNEIDRGHPKGQIKATSTAELTRTFETILNEIRQTRRLKLKEIANKIGISYFTLWEYQKREKAIPF